MKIVKGISNSIVAFLLCLAMIGTFVTILFSKTYLNQEYMLNQLSENGYYEKVETDLKNGLEEYQYQSGLPVEVFENLYTSEMIKEDVDSIIHYIYEGTEVENHAEIVEEKIHENINQYLQENDIVLKTEQNQNIEGFKKIIVNVYESQISLVMNYIEPIAKVREKVAVIIEILEKILIGILIALLVIALLINLKVIGGFLSTTGVSLLASGILFELVNLVIVKNIEIEKLLLFSQALSDLIKEMMYDLLSQFVEFGIWFIAVGVIAIVVGNYSRVREME